MCTMAQMDQRHPYTVADGINGKLGKLRYLGGGFWHLSFGDFADIMPTEALQALIICELIVCACPRCRDRS